MPDHLVRVRQTLSDGSVVERNVGAAYAKSKRLEVLDEPARDRSGALRPESRTRGNGRPVKPQTSIAEAVEKKAAESADLSDNAPSDEEF